MTRDPRYATKKNEGRPLSEWLPAVVLAAAPVVGMVVLFLLL